MKILYAGTGYKPAYRLGGPIVSVSATAEMLVRKGHDVTVVATTANNEEDLNVPVGVPVDVEGVTVWYFRRREPLQKLLPFVPYLSRSIGFMYAPEMRAALDRLVPLADLVHTQGPFVYPSYAAAHAAMRHHKPLLYSQRGCFAEERLRFRSLKKNLYLGAIEKPIMRRADVLVALTEAEEASYRALGMSTPVAILPNGIDIPAPRPGAVARIHARYGIAPDSLMVLFLGRLHPTKGTDKLLDAFMRVMEGFPRAVLMIAGPDEWGLERRWRERVARDAVGNRILFPGMIGGDDKADVLARADLFCLPSMAEGFSNAVLEALASSTAVMLSPACNVPEVEQAHAGVIVEADPEQMAAAMRELLGDPAALRAMGEAGRRLAERYSWDVITDRLADLYAAVVAAKA